MVCLLNGDYLQGVRNTNNLETQNFASRCLKSSVRGGFNSCMFNCFILQEISQGRWPISQYIFMYLTQGAGSMLEPQPHPTQPDYFRARIPVNSLPQLAQPLSFPGGSYYFYLRLDKSSHTTLCQCSSCLMAAYFNILLTPI